MNLCTTFERNKLFVHTVWTYLGYFISAHETWDQHFTCCIYMFVQYKLSLLLGNGFNRVLVTPYSTHYIHCNAIH